KDLDGPVDRATDAQCQTDDLAGAIAQRADSVERPLDAGTVVTTELADVRDHIGDVLGGHLAARERLLAAGEARLRKSAEIEHDLKEPVETLERPHAAREV